MNQTELLTSHLMQLYNTLIEPVLKYGSEIWGYHKAPEIESILSKICRILLCVKRSTNLDAMYGELGCLPMYIRRQLSMTKYWLKILQSHENSLLFKTYKMLKIDVDANKTYNKINWAYHIKLLLCGLSYLWINQFNIRIHFNTITSRILDIFKQSWYSNINNSNRLETHCLFKHEFIFESYLDQIRDSRFRIC